MPMAEYGSSALHAKVAIQNRGIGTCFSGGLHDIAEMQGDCR